MNIQGALAEPLTTATQNADPGYRIIEPVLSHRECDALLEALTEASVDRGRAGARHLMTIPEVAAIARDPLFLNVARAELHSEPFAFRATLFEKSGKANWLVVWHQDTALSLKHRFDAEGWGPWSQKAGVTYAHAPSWALERVVALRVHLDPSTENNGPLRVVPNSQRLGVLTDEEIAQVTKQNGFVECCVQRGGIVVMRPLIIHSSSKARTNDPRRVLHIEYADAQCLVPGIELSLC